MRSASSGLRACAKYLMENDNSRSFFDGLIERMAPIIIERRLARGDTMEQVEDFLTLFCWVGPRAAMAERKRP